MITEHDTNVLLWRQVCSHISSSAWQSNMKNQMNFKVVYFSVTASGHHQPEGKFQTQNRRWGKSRNYTLHYFHLFSKKSARRTLSNKVKEKNTKIEDQRIFLHIQMEVVDYNFNHNTWIWKYSSTVIKQACYSEYMLVSLGGWSAWFTVTEDTSSKSCNCWDPRCYQVEWLIFTLFTSWLYFHLTKAKIYCFGIDCFCHQFRGTLLREWLTTKIEIGNISTMNWGCCFFPTTITRCWVSKLESLMYCPVGVWTTEKYRRKIKKHQKEVMFSLLKNCAETSCATCVTRNKVNK